MHRLDLKEVSRPVITIQESQTQIIVLEIVLKVATQTHGKCQLFSVKIELLGFAKKDVSSLFQALIKLLELTFVHKFYNDACFASGVPHKPFRFNLKLDFFSQNEQ